MESASSVRQEAGLFAGRMEADLDASGRLPFVERDLHEAAAGLLHVWLTFFVPGMAGPEGCSHA